MAEFLKVPKYIDNTPREYKSFTGGINNDNDNENLFDHQLRDALNCDYRNGNIKRRLGAKEIKNLEYLDYHPNEHSDLVQGAFVYTARMNTYLIVVRDGFVYYGLFKKNQDKVNLTQIHISVDDYTSLTDYDENNLIVGLHHYDNEDRPKFNERHDGFVFDAGEKLVEHYPFFTVDESEPTGKIQTLPKSILVLQNYKSVDGAMFDFKLYLATGTRYVVLEEKDGDEPFVVGQIVPPRVINGFQFKNIGVNNLSPFPNYLMASSYNLASSTIENIIPLERKIFIENPVMNLKAIMNYQTGKVEDDYSFKWEYKLPGLDWQTFNLFKHGFNDEVEIDLTGQVSVGDTVSFRCTYSDLFRKHMITSRQKLVQSGNVELTEITSVPGGE